MLSLKYIFTRNSKSFITSNVLHRWKVFNGNKYMNCQEKIEKCNSMVFEDYSLSKNPIIKEKEQPKQDDDDDDFGMVALTYYHF